jgi:predicted metal-dependent phosphoesterase TrpH
MAGFDMHVHSTASDGAVAPADLVQLAKDRGLLGMALTDHDTASGFAEAFAKAGELDFTLIPGIELSAETNEKDVHVLGYWLDPDKIEADPDLREMREARFQRCYEIVSRLDRLGIAVDAAQIIAAAGEHGTPGRPHIAMALVQEGYCGSIKEAFNKWLSRGMPGYVARQKLGPQKAIEIIVKAGGVAVLAHPGMGVPDSLIPRLASAGLAGIEVYHPEHNTFSERKYLQLAQKYHLAATGGSDFHVQGIRSIGCRITNIKQLGVLAAKREAQLMQSTEQL